MNEYFAKFRANLAKSWKHISTYVVFFATGLWAYWLQMSPADQAAVFSVFPELRLVAPIASVAAFLLAKGLPQNLAAAEAPQEEPK